MTNKELCLNAICDELYNNLIFAKSKDYIRKPYSWALYQTWKMINDVEHEKPRESEEE